MNTTRAQGIVLALFTSKLWGMEGWACGRDDSARIGPEPLFRRALRTAWIGLAVLAIGSCAVTPITEVRSMDPEFTDQTLKERLGIVRFDVYTKDPSDSAAMSAAGSAGAVGGAVGGLIAGLVYIAVQDAQNEKDFSVDSQAVRLHDESVAKLIARLKESELVEPVDAACGTSSDPIETSRRVRESRLHGSKAPTAEEIQAFMRRHSLDYALYSTHLGADSPAAGVFLRSDWTVYDKEATPVVVVVCRSVDPDANRRTQTSIEITDRFLSLFEDNMDKFFSAVSATEQTADGSSREGMDAKGEEEPPAR